MHALCFLRRNSTFVYFSLVMGLTKCTPNEFVPSIIVDGLLMEKNLGVLNFFVLILQIPTYLGSRGGALFLQKFFQQIQADRAFGTDYCLRFSFVILLS